MEGLAGDVAAGLRGEKNHCPGQVLRDLDPAERDVFLELEKEGTVVSARTARVIRIGARTFTLKILSQVSSLTLKGSANVINPALFTRTSM
jgi:hypothetical protein